jgi:hypothetical protein
MRTIVEMISLENEKTFRKKLVLKTRKLYIITIFIRMKFENFNN